MFNLALTIYAVQLTYEQAKFDRLVCSSCGAIGVRLRLQEHQDCHRTMASECMLRLSHAYSKMQANIAHLRNLPFGGMQASDGSGLGWALNFLFSRGSSVCQA